jgi:hypothetical protein
MKNISYEKALKEAQQKGLCRNKPINGYRRL